MMTLHLAYPTRHADPAEIARTLRSRVTGDVWTPEDEGYDTHRRALLPGIDPHPAIVVEANDRHDVRQVVAAAHDSGLPFAVQATGHGTRVPCDGGILLKTTGMTSVLVDPERRTARVAAGARWRDVLAAAAPFGLAPLSGSSPDVGVVGYTLGGGVGWLARKYGFAADSVLRAEVVTADGTPLTVSATERPELFWALRGGGGSFGVVTWLEFALYPVRQVYAGIAHFPIENARAILTRYAEWTPTLPDEMSTALTLSTRSDGTRTVGLKVLYAGETDEAERLLRPIRQVAGPVVDGGFETTTFAEAAMGGTAARRLDLVEDLSEQLIDLVLQAHRQPEVSTVEIRHWAGAMSRPGPNAGPVGHRDVPYSVIIDGPVPDTLSEALDAHATGGKFLNFLADTTRTPAAYTRENHRLLRAIKRRYDPTNLFGIGHAIRP